MFIGACVTAPEVLLQLANLIQSFSQGLSILRIGDPFNISGYEEHIRLYHNVTAFTNLALLLLFTKLSLG